MTRDEAIEKATVIIWEKVTDTVSSFKPPEAKKVAEALQEKGCLILGRCKDCKHQPFCWICIGNEDNPSGNVHTRRSPITPDGFCDAFEPQEQAKGQEEKPDRIISKEPNAVDEDGNPIHMGIGTTSEPEEKATEPMMQCPECGHTWDDACGDICNICKSKIGKPKSKCCGADVRLFRDIKEVLWFCNQCGNPCDIQEAKTNDQSHQPRNLNAPERIYEPRFSGIASKKPNRQISRIVLTVKYTDNTEQILTSMNLEGRK